MSYAASSVSDILAAYSPPKFTSSAWPVKPAEPRYAVCYRNKPRVKGSDSFLCLEATTGATTGDVKKARQFFDLKEAIWFAVNYPVDDAAHEKASVVKVQTVERVEITEVTDL